MMGKYIIKIEEFYLLWSTIVDAPTTYGMSLDEFKDFYRGEYGNEGMRDLPRRLERVEEKGLSAFDTASVEDLIIGNRAGPSESELTLDEIYRAYCL